MTLGVQVLSSTPCAPLRPGAPGAPGGPGLQVSLSGEADDKAVGRGLFIERLLLRWAWWLHVVALEEGEGVRVRQRRRSAERGRREGLRRGSARVQGRPCCSPGFPVRTRHFVISSGAAAVGLGTCSGNCGSTLTW